MAINPKEFTGTPALEARRLGATITGGDSKVVAAAVRPAQPAAGVIEKAESPKPHALLASLIASHIFEARLQASKDPDIAEAYSGEKGAKVALIAERQRIIDALATSLQAQGLEAQDAKLAARNIATDVSGVTLTGDTHKDFSALYQKGAQTAKAVAASVAFPADDAADLKAYKEKIAEKAAEERIKAQLIAQRGPQKSGADVLMAMFSGMGTMKTGPMKPLDDMMAKLDGVAYRNLAAINAHSTLGLSPSQVKTQASLIAALSHHSFSIYFDPINNPTVEAGVKIAAANVIGYGGATLSTAGDALKAGIGAFNAAPSSPDGAGLGEMATNVLSAAGTAAKTAATTAKDVAPQKFDDASRQIDSQIRVDALSKVAHAMIHRGGDMTLTGIKASPEVLAHLTPEARAAVEANRARRVQGKSSQEPEITLQDIAAALDPKIGQAAFAMTGSYPRGIGVAQIPISKDLHKLGFTLWANAGGPPTFDPAMERKYAARGLIVSSYGGQRLASVPDRTHDASTKPGTIFGIIGHTKPVDGPDAATFGVPPYRHRRPQDYDDLPPRG